MTVLFAALLGGMSLGQAAPNWSYFQNGRAAGGRIWRILDRFVAVSLESDYFIRQCFAFVGVTNLCILGKPGRLLGCAAKFCNGLLLKFMCLQKLVKLM